jgi:hypothetical protein
MGGCDMRTKVQDAEELPQIKATARIQLLKTVID